MRTTVILDDGLLAQAVKAGGFKTKRDAIVTALQEFVARRERTRLLDLVGTVEFEPGHLQRLDARALEDAR
jgi:Arc/MetJ family transcription regulator